MIIRLREFNSFTNYLILIKQNQKNTICEAKSKIKFQLSWAGFKLHLYIVQPLTRSDKHSNEHLARHLDQQL